MALIAKVLFPIFLVLVSNLCLNVEGYKEMEINLRDEDQTKAINLALENVFFKYGKDNINAMKLVSICKKLTSVQFYLLIYAINLNNRKEVELFAIFVISEFELGMKIMRVNTIFKVENVNDITIHQSQYVSIQKQMIKFLQEKNDQRLEVINSIREHGYDFVVFLEANGKDKVYIIHDKYNNNNEVSIIEFI